MEENNEYYSNYDFYGEPKFNAFLFKRKGIIWKTYLLIDKDCMVGYDLSMQTHYFLTSLINQDGFPLIWLGKKYAEFPTLESLIKKLRFDNLILKIKDL